MELRQLHYFITVAKELHFGHAAERLGMTQPPLSQQIRALEEELGIRLFHRTNRRVELTEAGQALQQDVERLLTELDLAVSHARHIHQGQSGILRLGITVSAPFVEVFARSVLTFRQSHPHVQLSLHEHASQAQVEALLERRLDIGMLRPLNLPQDLEAIELLREPLVMAMPITHPMAQTPPDQAVPLARFAHEGFVAFPRGVGFALERQINELCRQAGFVRRIVQEARETTTQIALVAAGLGVAIIPALQQRIQVRTVTYRTIADEAAQSSIWMVYRRFQQNSLVRDFINLVRTELAREGKNDP
ncbi:MAG: LysR family transcriptional regulator [Paludibacterium sp.]|uniref:LysR family transcriptional regulator n=1 Tax=Paludibacterium sp. TaxID=1917523 RepID=UPI0025E1AC43|nr:LysR family transcriptional regulator [Paludibacterium sp.]MBV8046587.1 LysR family transcriptional regulator [Paludibacterium sp.]MBV8647759.1 LysR family transcriptional regulator [Paludibacterium sp.]